MPAIPRVRRRTWWRAARRRFSRAGPRAGTGTAARVGLSVFCERLAFRRVETVQQRDRIGNARDGHIVLSGEFRRVLVGEDALAVLVADADGDQPRAQLARE